MNDYYIYQFLKDEIIKGYDIKDQTITVYLEKGVLGFINKHLLKKDNSIRTFNHTEETLELIKERMKKQTKSTSDDKSTIYLNFFQKFWFFATYINCFLGTFVQKSDIPVALNITLTIMYSLLFTILNLIGIDSIITLRTMKKFIFFEKKENLINENINDSRVLNGVNNELVSELSKETSSQIKLELKDLNKCSLKDLKRIVLNIKKIKESEEDTETNNMQNNSRFIKIREFIKK